MKLGSLRSDTPDGQLVVLSRDLAWARPVPEIARTMQSALDRWSAVEGALKRVSDELNSGKTESAVSFDPTQALSPLPRCYMVYDASNYLRHHQLMGRMFNRPVIGATLASQGVPVTAVRTNENSRNDAT